MTATTLTLKPAWWTQWANSLKEIMNEDNILTRINLAFAVVAKLDWLSLYFRSCDWIKCLKTARLPTEYENSRPQMIPTLSRGKESENPNERGLFMPGCSRHVLSCVPTLPETQPRSVVALLFLECDVLEHDDKLIHGWHAAHPEGEYKKQRR